MTKTYIDNAIERATRHESHLDSWALGVRGFSTGTMRRLMSNLAHTSAVRRVLEVGAYAGGTTVAFANNNPNVSVDTFENCSQDFGIDDVCEELTRNLALLHSKDGKVRWFNEDFFIREEFDGPYQVFFYDGHHDEGWQAAALVHAFDAMDKKFLYVVDDWTWATVRDGTATALAELHGEMNVIADWSLVGKSPNDDPVWHNGVGLFLCEKV